MVGKTRNILREFKPVASVATRIRFCRSSMYRVRRSYLTFRVRFPPSTQQTNDLLNETRSLAIRKQQQQSPREKASQGPHYHFNVFLVVDSFFSVSSVHGPYSRHRRRRQHMGLRRFDDKLVELLQLVTSAELNFHETAFVTRENFSNRVA